jgi:hypothetical protein
VRVGNIFFEEGALPKGRGCKHYLLEHAGPSTTRDMRLTRRNIFVVIAMHIKLNWVKFPFQYFFFPLSACPASNLTACRFILKLLNS